MDDPLILEVLDRLDADRTLTDKAENLVIGALIGRLDEVIGGAVVEQPDASMGEGAVPVRAYLESVTVTGFRGIGPSCELRLHPGPGLTLVVGRNGSGKSSIAEAAEFALTGDSLRWSGKTLDWKRGWRNLHADADPRICVRLRADGEQHPHAVAVSWSAADLGSAKTLVTVPGQEAKTLESLGWGSSIKAFRPFLSYRELSTMTEGRPVDRYNALAPMLGMESLRTPIANLGQSRLSSDKQMKAAKSHVHDVIHVLAQKSGRTGCYRCTGPTEALGSSQGQGSSYGYRTRGCCAGPRPRHAHTASVSRLG